MPKRIDFVRKSLANGRAGSACIMLASTHQISAMRAKYIENNNEKFKQHLHVARKISLKSIEPNEKTARFDTGSELFDAPLSDSPLELIETHANFAPEYYAAVRNDPLNPQFLVHMWQLTILGDYEALHAKVEKLAKNGRKPWRKDCAEGNDFFSLLMRGDKAGLEARITKDIKLGNDDPITGDFFAYIATFEAKLCWHKGIDVQIDSPRVPMDLMPVRPLARYDDVYDFLKPGWVPPKPGLLGRMARLLGK